MKRLAAVLAAALPGLALAEATTWNIDTAHTQTGFSVRHLVIATVKGDFGKTTGSVVYDEKDPSKSSVEATIDVTTLSTRIADRDAHLKSPDFLDAAKHPTIAFKSTKVEKAGDGKLRVAGNLTMRGVTKPAVLEVEGPTGEVKGARGEIRRGFSARTTVNRMDWGVAWSKAVEAGPVVGNEVKVEIEGELVKK
ncbi:MAG TPA: YceI family protein [Anaeromyxobacteraceae bacterium]|jgi:polyisoprenoid-binding protein YceI